MEKGKRNWIWAALLAALGVLLWMIPGMKFSAAFCMGLAVLCVIGRALDKWAEKARAGKICKGVFRCGVLLGLAALLCFEVYLVSRGKEDVSHLPVDAVVVLGAGVNGETPSLILQSRIDAAAAYLQKHPDIPVVLSGGQGPGEDITEAEAMRRALEEEAGSRLILEEKSTSTAENLAFSKELLLAHGIDPQEDAIAVVTNDFHILRAGLLAQREGYGTVYGVGAPVPWWWLEVNYYLREAFAMGKALIFR